MNKKGFTVVELIVSFSLTMMVVIFLFELLVSLKELYSTSGTRTELLNKQALMSKKMNDDFNNKKIKIATKCGDYCLSFIFEDNSNAILEIDKESNLFRYGDYNTKLIEGSTFGNINISSQSILGVDRGKNDSIIHIEIPIHHVAVRGEFGINIAYQYDSRTTGITNIVIDDAETGDNKIVLKGSNDISTSSTTNFADPGYYVVEADGTIIENDPRVEIEGSVGVNTNTVYTLIYKLVINGKIVDTKLRHVTVVGTEYTYDYTGDVQVFTAPANGVYQIELWGAQGSEGYNTQTGHLFGGKGAYTSGMINLTKGQQLYFYVGEGGASGKGTVTFNGGGASLGYNNKAASGGGATDVRLMSGAWDNETGLRSRIMVAAGGGGLEYGGAGGALAGSSGNFQPVVGNTYIGNGGTQTGGGKVSTNGGLAGTFGKGGNASPYTGVSGDYYGGAGGGGYYGGSGAKWHAGGGGGSSFISGYPGCIAVTSSSNTTPKNTVYTKIEDSYHYSNMIFTNGIMKSGSEIMPNPRGKQDIQGNTGHGYARVRLISTEANPSSVYKSLSIGTRNSGFTVPASIPAGSDLTIYMEVKITDFNNSFLLATETGNWGAFNSMLSNDGGNLSIGVGLVDQASLNRFLPSDFNKTLPLNEKVTIIYTYNNKTKEAVTYINGTKYKKTFTTAPLAINSFQSGASRDWYKLIIYNRALSEEDIADLNKGTVTYNGLLRYYKFDNGDASFVRDYSNNHINASIIGEPNWLTN